MVKETRIIFEVGDLVALRYQCGGEACNQEMLFRLDNGGSPPLSVPFMWASVAQSRATGQP